MYTQVQRESRREELFNGLEESLAFLGLVILLGKQSLCFAFTSFERERHGERVKCVWFFVFLTLGFISHTGPSLMGRVSLLLDCL